MHEIHQMKLPLDPKLPQRLFEGEGGSYDHWSSSDLPVLKDAKVGAGRLVLKPLGFALPHYADSAKVGYVLEGRAMAGLLRPHDLKEKIVRLERGDTVPVPIGSVSWWYNDSDDSDFTIIFLGDTSSAVDTGEFTYFFLAGSVGIFTGFPTEFIAKSMGVSDDQAKELFGSQPGTLIIKLQQKLPGLEPVKNVVADGGLLSAEVVRLEAGGAWGPRYSSEAAVQVICVTGGSGRFQTVTSGGKRVMDAEVEAGRLFVVPAFAVTSSIAGGRGLEWFSITTSRPVYGYLTGKRSLLKALSPQVLAAALNVNEELVELLFSKNNDK